MRGAGEFSDDRWVETATHAVVVRSPHAHARIAPIRVSAALARSGVLAIFTGRDIAEHLRPLPCLVAMTSRDGRPRAEADRAILATDRVRHVGDGVAFVVAETLAQALDAAEAVQVIYEPLPATTRPGDISTVPIWPEAPDNLCFDWGTGDAAACDRLFAAATHVTRLRLEIPRIVIHPMEPRTAVGQYDPGCSRYTLVSPTQGVHLVRRILAASFGIAEDRFRVISPDVGGGFGSKIFAYPEHALVLWAARALGRPVRWCASRSESFLSDTQGRGRVTEAALALDADGRFLALRVNDTADLGAYLSQYGPYTAAGCGAPVQAGAYRIAAMDLRVRACFTNTTPIDSYRGTGRPEATYVLERLIDQAAFELGIDRAALRERNMRPASDTPVVLSTGQAVDGGRFLDNQRICLQAAEYAGFSDRRRESEARRKLRGFGFGNYIESNGSFGVAERIDHGSLPTESAAIRFGADGRVVIYVGTQSSGQEHASPLINLLSQTFGTDPAKIVVQQGDTEAVRFGGGTGGSKSTLTNVAAVGKAIKQIQAQAIALIAERHGVPLDAVEFHGGLFHVRNTNLVASLSELAACTPGRLDVEVIAHLESGSYCNGCHACEIEIDPETGEVAILSYIAVNDFGRILNVANVEGQVQGGIAQGIGQALLERAVYDPTSGQLLSGSQLDYTLPRAEHVPAAMVFKDNGLVCATNALGIKACGESGANGAIAPVINAVVHALRAYPGAEDLQIPATPQAVWTVLNRRHVS